MPSITSLLALLGLLLLVVPAQAAPDRPDPARMTATEVTALQRQLTDARCYTGPLDGRPSDALTQALAACPDPRLMLRIETGMHVAAIKSVDADARCRLLATGSEDKTVRLWAMPEGRLLRTQRLPIGAGDHGKIYAVAVSPDGGLVAAGGWDANAETGGRHGIYVFDAATGTRMRRLGSFENVVSRLAFSPDGQRLAVALSDEGVRVLDVATGRELMADRDFGGKTTSGVAFGPDGSLYAVGYDATLRRYEAVRRPSWLPFSSLPFKPAVKVKVTGGKEPSSVAVDSAGSRIAVGYGDYSVAEVYDAASLKLLYVADVTLAWGKFSRVAWSRDGTRLMAGGNFIRGERSLIRRFSADGRQVVPDMAVADDTITSITSCGDGVAFGAFDPAFGLVAADGTVQTLVRSRTADMRVKVRDAFTVSPDGTRVRFGLDIGINRLVLFDLGRGILTDASGAAKDLVNADVASLPITGWEGSRETRLDGSLLADRGREAARALAVRPDRAGFVLGTDFWLHSYDVAGRKRWRVPVPASALGANLARRGELVVIACADGTIRWHRWSDGRELLALFVNKDTRAWVAWTPTGYYAASPGGEDLIGWHVNRGWEQPADFFPASKFRDTYARPDIVERVLATLDEAKAVRQADAARPGRPPGTPPMLEHLPPVVSILSPVEGSAVSGDEVRLDYVVRSPSGLPVDAVEALVDGRPVSGSRGLGRADAQQVAVRECLATTRGLGRADGAMQGCRGSVSVRLPPGTHEVGLFARSGERAGEVARIRLTRAGTETLRPALYALVVGVSAYANPDYRLAFAAKDASDFAAALQHQRDGLYGDVTVRSLTDGAATATAVRDGLDWLTKQVTSRDVGLVYLAGHGLLDERDRFYFLPSDGDAERVRATGVPREDIQAALDTLPGKALLFLDACHSGAVAGQRRPARSLNINLVANEFAGSERGIVAFTASTGRQVSQENAAWGNGAFTKAVIEGLGTVGRKAKADLLGRGRITTSGLDTYVSDRVRELTNGEQTPIMIRPATVPDFPLALVR